MRNKNDVQKISQRFFEYFDPQIKVEVEENDGYRIKVESEMSGFLIGRFGETLETIQYLLRLMTTQLAGEYIPLTVDIAGYKQKRDDELKELALQMAENVKTSGYAQELRPMNAYERRVIHVALKDFKGIKADSVGEGELRRIRVEAV